MNNKNLNGKILFRKLTNNKSKEPILSQVILVIDGPNKNLPPDDDQLVYKVEHCTTTPDAAFCEKTNFYDLTGVDDKNDIITPIEETPIEDVRSFVKRIFRNQ